MTKLTNWQQITNTRLFVIRKWLFELVKEKFANHEEIAERISQAVATDRDLQAFGKLIGDIYEAGFMKAINDYREEFRRMGLDITIKPQIVN